MRKQADGKVRRSHEEWERIFDRFHSGTMVRTYHSATIVADWEEQSGESRLLLVRTDLN